MRPIVRRALLQAEDTLRQEVRNMPLVARVYDIGLQEGLSLEQIALLALPELINRNRELMNNALAEINTRTTFAPGLDNESVALWRTRQSDTSLL